MTSVNRCSNKVRSASLQRGNSCEPCRVSRQRVRMCCSFSCSSSCERWEERLEIHRWHSMSKRSLAVSPSMRLWKSWLFHSSGPMILLKSFSVSENSDLSAPMTSTSITSINRCLNFITRHFTIGVRAELMTVSRLSMAVNPNSSSSW